MSYDILPLIVSAATSFGTSYLANGEYGPISTLSDLWYKKFGYLREDVKDTQYKRELDRQAKYVHQTTSLTAEAIAKIPIKELHEPRENIVRPSVSAIEDYGSEEHTREMFSKLIAASMDARKDKIAQQCFVEIIKNMSPIDAAILKEHFHHNIHMRIVEIRTKNDGGSCQTEFENLCLVPYTNPSREDYELYSASIVNLQRLGLIDIDYSGFIPPAESYDRFNETPIYEQVSRSIEQSKQTLEITQTYPNNYSAEQLEELKVIASRHIDIAKGRAKITPLGKAFVSTCVCDE